MHSDILLVARPDRGPRIECSGALAARRTAADTVHLLSAAATPLGGDTISVRIVVEAGARLRVRSAAATMVLPSATTVESHSAWDLQVDGELDLDLQPTVIAGGSRHAAGTRLRLGTTGRVRVRESVQIGRSGESDGYWTGALHADVDGVPLLRHRVELGAATVADDELGSPRACVSELRYPQTSFESPGTVLELAAGGCLATWQGARL
ncbi:urease accessory protein UreD [Mycolicibacterium fluoranthenivorans]|uniref:Urease accessory protein n=1 Tax=Mycolicibacterium fluoranthenivorans TaxID=258505 RepID=A0A7X5U132_9MYCO|nr:urease accessory protein UreD [Mycolicibacterium fluoranthenivorans]MCV7354953.1 urease accessory protein UreD [Mycolicibacterium fluoranthenivorans]NIH96457.1 urease accessory protein [Mycolicibacterium fluoranthenivorans]